MKRKLVLTPMLACMMLVTSSVVDAGGMRGAPPGLSVRAPIGKGQANASTAAVAGAALAFGGWAMSESGWGWREDPPLLIVDAAPASAWVYLDGQPIGSAGELIARGLPVAYGPHVIQIVAPGYQQWAERFVADGSFPTRIRATLARE
jgi:PEGA domain